MSKKTQEEKEEENKKKRRFIIILLLLLLFFFFLLDVDDLIIGTPLRPRLTKVDENWYKEKVVKIEEDAYTRKNLSHYLYCIRQDDDISKCEWKETYTKNVVVSQNGENYVWFKGVTEDGLVETTEANITVIDNTVPEEDVNTDNQEGTDTESGTEVTKGTETTEPEKQEGEEVNEKEETTTTESTEKESTPSTE